MTPADTVLWAPARRGPSFYALVLAGVLTVVSAPAVGQEDPGDPATEPAAASAPSEAQPAEPEDAPGVETTVEAGTSTAGFPLHGFVSTPYRLRLHRDGDDRDQDLAAVVSLDAGDRTRHTATAHVMGRLAWDLDAHQDTQGFYPFDNVSDEAGPAEGRLYLANVDLHRLPSLEVVRLGRQSVYDAPEFAFFDGLRLESTRLTGLKLRLGAYGGRTAHILDEWTALDVTAGGFAQISPWTGARLRTDVLYLQDDNFVGQYDNSFAGLSLWQSLGDHVELFGKLTAQDAALRDATTSASLYDAEHSITAELTYFVLIEPREQVALPLDAFSAQMLRFNPYHEVRASVAKGCGDHLFTEIGYQGRQVTDSADEGVYNHSFHRVHLTPSVQDMGIDGLSLSVTGELWTGDDQRQVGGGAELGYHHARTVRTALGTSYALYKFDLLLDDEEQIDVQTYYVRADVEMLEGLRANARYEFETHGGDAAGSDQFQTLRVGLLWSF